MLHPIRWQKYSKHTSVAQSYSNYVVNQTFDIYIYIHSTDSCYVFIYAFPGNIFYSHLNYNADCNVKPMETRHKESLKQSSNTISTCNLYNITRSTENNFYFHKAGSSSLYSLILDEQKTTANNIGMTDKVTQNIRKLRLEKRTRTCK